MKDLFFWEGRVVYKSLWLYNLVSIVGRWRMGDSI